MLGDNESWWSSELLFPNQHIFMTLGLNLANRWHLAFILYIIAVVSCIHA